MDAAAQDTYYTIISDTATVFKAKGQATASAKNVELGSRIAAVGIADANQNFTAQLIYIITRPALQ